MKSKKILIVIVIALIVALFVNMMIIKSKQTNKIDMVSEKEIVNEINYTEEEKENIVVESKKEEQKTQEEADITENVSQQELQKQTTIVTQDKKVENPKQAEQPKATQVTTKQKTQVKEQPKQNIKTETQILEQPKVETKTEEKQPETPKCTDIKHGVGVGNSNKWFNSKQEAINFYQGITKTWGDKWEKFEIDDETYQKNCPYGYETWSCPFCEKWTINFYYN